MVYEKLSSISPYFVPGRQEDADECVRNLLEAMHKAYLARGTDSEEAAKESPISRIFDGMLIHSTECGKCAHKFSTSVEFRGFSLNISKSNSLQRAVELHLSVAKVHRVMCDSCQERRSKMKRSEIERAPESLYVQLQRFTRNGDKIRKHVAIPNSLTLSSQQNSCVQYKLVAVIIHHGKTINSGHYSTMALAENEKFYHLDDRSVQEVNLQDVLNSNPYLCVYELNRNTV